MRIPSSIFPRSDSRGASAMASASGVALARRTPNKRWFHFGTALAGVIWLVGVAHALGPGQTFKSPLKNFTIEVPSVLFHTKVAQEHDKDGGVVAFSGTAGQFQRIDYFRRSEGNAVPADSVERHAHYQSLIEALLKGHPGSQILSEKDITLDGIGMLQALVRFPEGSHIQNARTGKQIDSVR